MPLEQEQEELLSTLVEAYRNLPRKRREPFLVLFLDGERNASINHPGLADRKAIAYPGDIETLARQGFIAQSFISGSNHEFDINPQGFAYYRQMKERETEPLDRIETEIDRYLESSHFQGTYAKAYQKWKNADSLLWDSESEQQLTTIGHLCREAIQEFATSLVERYRPANVDENKAHDVNRLKAVIELRAVNLGNTEKEFLNALIPYWRTVSGLVQRQEHGSQPGARHLVWEDGRRVVFQTAIVMSEVDRSLSRID